MSFADPKRDELPLSFEEAGFDSYPYEFADGELARLFLPAGVPPDNREAVRRSGIIIAEGEVMPIEDAAMADADADGK